MNSDKRNGVFLVLLRCYAHEQYNSLHIGPYYIGILSTYELVLDFSIVDCLLARNNVNHSNFGYYSVSQSCASGLVVVIIRKNIQK